jgi:hypothetical protein
VYVERHDGSLRFRWVQAPTSVDIARLTQALALRIGRYLERQGLLERDAENSYLVGDALESGAMEQLMGSSIIYRIAVGPQQGRKVFTLPACEEPFDDGVGKVARYSLHAGMAARADQRQKLGRLCRYISWPAISEKRLSLTPNENVRYQRSRRLNLYSGCPQWANSVEKIGAAGDEEPPGKASGRGFLLFFIIRTG